MANASAELAAYAAANYTLIQLSDRQAKDVNKTAAEAWAFIQQSITACDKLGMQVLIDTYSPLTRECPAHPPSLSACDAHQGCAGPWNDIKGGFSQVVTNSPDYVGGWVDLNMSNSRDDVVAMEKKVTVPELQWMAAQVQHNPAVVGLLLTDDGADLSSEEIEMVAWMRDNTPELMPWANQCADGSEWLARAGVQFNVPEIYAIDDRLHLTPKRPKPKNATLMCAQQVAGYDNMRDRSDRWGLQSWPIYSKLTAPAKTRMPSTSNPWPCCADVEKAMSMSPNLLRFPKYSALAYGANQGPDGV